MLCNRKEIKKIDANVRMIRYFFPMNSFALLPRVKIFGIFVNMQFKYLLLLLYARGVRKR